MRFVITMAVLLAIGAESQAGPFRRRAQQQAQPVQSYSASQYSHSYQSTPYGYREQSSESHQSFTSYGSNDALEEVNRDRARRGLRPFLPDPNLTIGAQRAAQARAERGISGHLPNDFAMLPPGTHASSAGCGAWPAGTVTVDGTTWGTCCTFESKYTYAGAAWAMGRDGKRYMHLFVR